MGTVLTDQQWRLLYELVDQGMDLDGADRARWLDQLDDRHAALKPLLASALARAASGETGDFIATLPKLGAAYARDNAATAEGLAAGQCIGPYQLIRELGRGGMGSVWLAERGDALVTRRVALKFPHVAARRPELTERFAREREILSTLSHPNIARLYDVGLSAGQPYLAMEYVEGRPLTEYCDSAGLGVRERIVLFMQALAAVQYAHERLVVHRDLKPSNMLVTAAGEVRLLDFGIAKLLLEGEAKETELTQLGGRALTPDYASPEQILGQPVTTASDVYSLGVVLYELLCGNRPYRLKRDSRGALEDAILAADPVTPSDAAITQATSDARSTTVRKLVKALAGDLDTIVLKALKKQPAERYATADAFAQDIDRHLRGEAVLARPDSVWYRTRKFLWRNKLGAASTAVVFIALAAGLGLALWQARIARSEAHTAEAVQAFLEDIFRANSTDQTDPLKAQQTTARELLDVGLKKIDTALADTPSAKLRVLMTLSRMYADLRLTQQAVDLQRKRVQLAQSIYGKAHPMVADALLDLSDALFVSQHADERAQVLNDAAWVLDQIGDRTSKTRAHLLQQQVTLYYDHDSERALALAKQSVQLLRAFPPSRDLASALVTLGNMYGFRNDPAHAEAVLLEALSVIDQLHQPFLSEMPQLYWILADAQVDLQKFSAAEESYRKGASAARKIGDESHLDVIRADRSLGQFLFSTSRTREGLSLMESAKARILATRGDDDPLFTAWVLIGIGHALVQSGRIEEGLDDLSFAEHNQRRYRPDGAALALALEREAEAYVELGRYDDARKSLAEASKIHLDAHEDGIQLNDNVRMRAHLSAVTGDADGAREAARRFRPADGEPGDLAFTPVERDLVKAEAALAEGRFDDAARMAGALAAETERSGLASFLRIYRAQAEVLQGKALLQSGRPADAVVPLKDAVALMSEMYDSRRSPALADALVTLADCYLRLNKRDEPKDLLAQAKAIHAAHKELGEHYTRALRELEARLQ